MMTSAVIILSPLAAAVLILLLRRWPAGLAIAGALGSLLAAIVTLPRIAEGAISTTALLGLPGLPLRLVAEPLGMLLATVVATVGVLVFVYAAGYMAHDPARVRFFACMAFFVAAMQALVLAGDWILFLAAWELIGLASYLLIGFWFDRPGVGGAAARAFLTTRAADVGLYLGVLALATTGTTEIGASAGVGGTTAVVASLGFLVAAIGKSAQVPLQGWLLDAMAGPTPVSALLHSATLVVAGVVLVIRASPLLPDELRLVVALVGGLTAIVTGVTAVAQQDVKRLLASSTSSQIGLMLLAVGAGSIGAAIVHLVANAAMKSALFLGAGIFQHTRRSTAFVDLAGVGRERRFAFVAFAIAGLALAGIPPLAGFWSKDAVIAAALTAPTAGILAPLAAVASVLTGIYIGRLLRLLWQPNPEEPRGQRSIDSNAVWMSVGLGALSVSAVILGLSIEPIGHFLAIEVPERLLALVLGLVASAVGLAGGWRMGASHRLGPAFDVALSGFRVDGGLEGLVVRPALALADRGDRIDRAIHAAVLGVGNQALRLAGGLWRIDRGVHAVVEGVGATSLLIARASRVSDEAGIDAIIANLVAATLRLGGHARRLQTGLVHRELLVAAGATAVVLIVILLS
jgi:NADH-quinone oxidoreductase subunit L